MAVGPVDVYIIGFPGNKFSGQIAPAILELVENGTIRVLDLLFVMKDADGVVTTLEAADIDEEGAAFLSIDITQPGALGPEDAEEVSDDLPAEQLGPPDRVREPLGRESGRRPAGRGRRVDRLDPDPGRRRGSVRGKLAPPLRDREVTTWDLYAWQPAPPSSREPPRPCPGACSAVRPPGTTSRTRSSTRSSRRSAATGGPAGGRRDRPASEPGAASRAGRAHRRGVRGRQGQDPRNLTGRARGPVRHVEAYSRLAGVYDEIVVDPCHDRWASFLHELWSADPEGVRSVLDLCCGTGLLAGELIARGYRVVGVDASEAMLALARERLGPDVALSRMTLPDLTVEGVFDAAVCTFDGFNYLTPDELRLTMAAVADRLRPAGWLVFDLHTDAMMDFTIANPVVAGESAGNDFVISSIVDPGARTCDTKIELTRPRDGDPFCEQHRQYFHADADVRAALAGRGLRGDRGGRGVHARAGGRLDPARPPGLHDACRPDRLRLRQRRRS